MKSAVELRRKAGEVYLKERIKRPGELKAEGSFPIGRNSSQGFNNKAKKKSDTEGVTKSAESVRTGCGWRQKKKKTLNIRKKTDPRRLRGRLNIVTHGKKKKKPAEIERGREQNPHSGMTRAIHSLCEQGFSKGLGGLRKGRMARKGKSSSLKGHHTRRLIKA